MTDYLLSTLAGTAGFRVHLLKPVSLESLQEVLGTIPAKDLPPNGSIGQ